MDQKPFFERRSGLTASVRASNEHADPKNLIAATRSHEAEAMRLLGEIEPWVAEVQA